MKVFHFLLAAMLAAQTAFAITGQVGAYVIAASPSPSPTPSPTLTPTLTNESGLLSPSQPAAAPAPVTGLVTAQELSKTIFDWLSGAVNAIASAVKLPWGLKVF